MSIEIAEFLHACGEPEMADAVENMHNRLEAFADGLDRDCIEAAGCAVEEITKQRDALIDALKECRRAMHNYRRRAPRCGLESACSIADKAIETKGSAA